MNEELKSHPHSGHEGDRIKNGITTWGSFITADSRFYINYGCDGEEIFPPVNRSDVTPVKTVSPWGGGGGCLSFPSFRRFP